MHNQTALRIKGALLFREGVVVISVPYHLAGEEAEEHIAEMRRRGIEPGAAFLDPSHEAHDKADPQVTKPHREVH